MVEYGFPAGLVPSGVVKPQGRDYNYFNKLAISWSSFGGGNNGNPDIFIPFSTQTVRFTNMTVDGYLPTTGASPLSVISVVEFSFNGTTVHGELGSGLHNVSLEFNNRVIGLVWFRVQSGSSGTVNVNVDAWGIR
jgi:hypothetical protein